MDPGTGAQAARGPDDGGWFLATAIGNKLAGFISGLAPTMKMFVVLSLAPLAVAVMILLLRPMLDRAIKKYRA